MNRFESPHFCSELRLHPGTSVIRQKTASDRVQKNVIDLFDRVAERVMEQNDLVIERGIEEGRIVGIDGDRHT